MYIQVLADGEIGMQECDNFSAFSIVRAVADAPLARLRRLAAEAADDDHYWLDAEAVAELSGRQGDQQWVEKFRAMLASVAPYGYYDVKTNRVKAHVELADEQAGD